MTNTTAILSWRVTADPTRWLIIPREPSHEWKCAAQALVLQTFAEIKTELNSADLETEAKNYLVAVASESVANLIGFAEDAGAMAAVVGALGVAGRGPIPVHVMVYLNQGSHPSDLFDATGARDPYFLYPPLIEYPDIEGCDALRVTRIDVDGEGSAWASVTLARRMPITDTLLTWRTTDIPLLAVMPDLLDELLGSISVDEVPG